MFKPNWKRLPLNLLPPQWRPKLLQMLPPLKPLPMPLPPRLLPMLPPGLQPMLPPQELPQMPLPLKPQPMHKLPWMLFLFRQLRMPPLPRLPSMP